MCWHMTLTMCGREELSNLTIVWIGTSFSPFIVMSCCGGLMFSYIFLEGGGACTVTRRREATQAHHKSMGGRVETLT